MEDLSKQIAELRKTIAALEERVAKLENAPSTERATKKGLTATVSKTYVESSRYGSSWVSHLVRFDNGKMAYLKHICTSDGNYTVGQTRKVADMFGYKYDSKTKREMLGFELVSKFGDGEWAFIGKNAVDANGVTYDVIETQLPYDPYFLKFATGQDIASDGKSYLEKYYRNKPLVVDPNWSPEEIAAKLFEFNNSLVRK